MFFFVAKFYLLTENDVTRIVRFLTRPNIPISLETIRRYSISLFVYYRNRCRKMFGIKLLCHKLIYYVLEVNFFFFARVIFSTTVFIRYYIVITDDWSIGRPYISSSSRRVFYVCFSLSRHRYTSALV